MRIKLPLLLLLSIPIRLISGDYYYYEGNINELQKRNDRVAFVLKNTISENEVRHRMENYIGSGNELKKVLPDVYQVSFSEMKTESQLDIYKMEIKSNTEIVKLVTSVYYGSSKRVSQIPGDVFIVKLRNPNDAARLNILNLENNCVVIGSSSDGKRYQMRTGNSDSRNALELSNLYYASGLFEYAEPDFIYPERCLLLSIPNDAYFNSQWALKNTSQTVTTGSTFAFQGDASTVTGITNADMNVSEVWDYTQGNAGIKIGIIDTGIDSLHPDLQSEGHLLSGYDAFNNAEGSSVDYGNHGTSVAGIIGAVTNNNIGISGIAPECRIMSITLYDVNGTTTSSIIARAFDTARVRGIDVICNGWGGGTPSSSVTDAINEAAINGRGGAGTVILFGSGNDGRNPPVYPSYLSNVISVGSSTTHDQKKAPGTGNQFYWGSNYGEDINGDLDITAPTNCYTLSSGGDYEANFAGTSASAPHAAGVAALILSVNASLSRTQVLNILYRGCDKIDNVNYSASKTYGKWNYYYGYGRVNALNSVRLAMGTDVTPPVILHSNVSSHSSTYPTIINADIFDQDESAVPESGINKPVLIYKTKRGTSAWSGFDSVSSFINSGSLFSFRIPSQGWETEIQYYIRARDNEGNETTFPKHAPNNFWLCYYAVGNITSETKKIPSFTGSDFGATISPSVNFTAFKILHAKFRIYMRHTYLNDEIIQIFSPLSDNSNNRKCLFSANGSDFDNITGASVTDSALQFWNNGTPPYMNGTYRPEFSLKGFNGQSAGGNWRILHFDRGIGDYAFFDSVKITLCKTTGSMSSSVRLNTPDDSLINFGGIQYPEISEKNFYIKNSGTSALSITGYSFTGNFAAMYSLTNTPPTTILPNDSGLFKVKLNTGISGDKSGTTGDNITGAVLNIQTNDPSKNLFKVSLQTNDSLHFNLKNLKLKVLIEGMYEISSNETIKDTLNVYLRNINFPYALVDSAKSVTDSTGEGSFNFRNSQDDVNYYIAVIHRNGLETWSATGQSFSNSLMTYDFTNNISKAYGNNLILKGSRYCLFSGDSNHDGFIDLTDLNLIFNATNIFKEGYSDEDINGDSLVDLTDLTIDYNNTIKFISAISPQ